MFRGCVVLIGRVERSCVIRNVLCCVLCYNGICGI